MRRFIIISGLLIKLIFLFQVMYSQVVTFNKEFILNNTSVQESFYGVVEYGNNYYVVGFTDPGGWNSCLVLTSVNNSGTVNWMKFYGTIENQYMFPGNRNAIIKTSDSCLAIALAYKNQQFEKRRTMILKVDTIGNVLWSNILNDTMYTDKDSKAQGLIETDDKGFAVYGQIQIMGILYKTDSIGELEWYQTFGEGLVSNYVYLHSMEQLPDLGYIVGASNKVGGVTNSGHARIYKINENGNHEWSQSIDGPYEDFGAFVKYLPDSSLLTVCSYGTEPAGNYYPVEQNICLTKFDLNGNNLWSKLLGGNDHRYTLNSVNWMNDGTLIVGGWAWGYTKAWLFNFTTTGDSLFYREYSYPSDSDTMRRIIDAKPTLDGGIIACAEFSYPIGSIYTDNAWLLKTDRYGCMEMGCDTMALYITSQPDTITHCKYEEVYLTMETMGSISTYQWQSNYNGTWYNLNNNFIFSGTHSDTLFIETSALGFPYYKFRCIVENEFYKIESDSMVLQLFYAPEITKDPKDFSAEIGDPGIFTIEATGTYQLNYQWYKNENIIENAIDSIYIIFSVTNSDSGYYHCVVSNQCDSIESDKAKLQITNLSVDKTEREPIIMLYPNPVKDMLIVTNNQYKSIQYFIYDIGLNSCISGKAEGKKIDLNLLKPGIYIVKLLNSRKETIYIGKIIKE